MRKLFFVLCLFLICGCSSVTKIEEDAYTHYLLDGDLPALYGGGYRIVEAWNGFKVEEFVGTGTDYEPNEIYRNDKFSIYREYGSKYTYTYKDKSKTTVLYTCPTTPKLFVEPGFPWPFEIDEQTYFFYYDIHDLVINTIKDGDLIEYKRIPLKVEDHEFKYFLYNDYEMYPIYKKDDILKFVLNENEYTFHSTDRVMILFDYIFCSTYEDEQVKNSYIINRKTNEKIQLDESIDIYLDIWDKESPDHYFEEYMNNKFVFKEKKDDQIVYSYAEIVDNTMKKIQLPYHYKERDRISFYDEKTIFLIKTNSKSNYDFHVIEIKDQ